MFLNFTESLNQPVSTTLIQAERKWKMKSCQEFLSEIREKILHAEDQLRAEKKNLYKVDELFTEEKEKWAKEVKAEQIKVQANEKELKKKEAMLEELKLEYEDMLKKCLEFEGENEKIKKEILKAKRSQQEEANKYLLEIAGLEKELSKIQEHQKDVRVTNKWAKVFQEKELKAQEAEGENKVKEEVKHLSDEFAKKIEAFDENLKDIEKLSLKPKQQKLRLLQETLAQIKGECEEMEKKNQELESQIALLKKMSPLS